MIFAGTSIPARIGAVIILLITCIGVARGADEDPGIWLILSATGQFDSPAEASRWHWWFDGQARYFDRENDVDQYLLRPAVGYKLTEQTSAWLGVASIVTMDELGNRREERRLWQGLSWSRELGNGKKLALRTRIAERRRDTGDGTAVWLRQRVALTIPVPNRDNIAWAIALEPFIDFRDTEWGANTGLSQFRSSVGARFRLRDRLSLESGYMNQYFPRDDQRDVSNHLVYLNFGARF